MAYAFHLQENRDTLLSGKFTFHSGDYSPKANYLFNDRKHLLLQAEQGWKCFYVLDGKQQCVAFVWLHIEEEVASSPLKAPFGSLEFTEGVSSKTLFDFLQFLESELRNLGVKKVIIKNPPDAYESSKTALLKVFLINLGFTVSHAEVSSVIKVNDVEYSNYVTDWEIRKLKQAKTDGFCFQQNNIQEISTLYTFIEKCRTEKGYKLSMSLSQLSSLQNAFPENVLLFSIVKQNQLVAACIGLQVSKDILYTFYYDHGASYHAYSPVVTLMEGIYTFCQQHAIHLLDLGTASLEGQPNFSLLDFKLHLGGVPSAKLTFQKEL